MAKNEITEEAKPVKEASKATDAFTRIVEDANGIYEKKGVHSAIRFIKNEMLNTDPETHKKLLEGLVKMKPEAISKNDPSMFETVIAEITNSKI